jgi:hypothetical protein
MPSWFNSKTNPEGFKNFLSMVSNVNLFLESNLKEEQKKHIQEELLESNLKDEQQKHIQEEQQDYIQQQVQVILLLGMVYSSYDKPSRGQLFRDNCRIHGLESLGYDVYTLDNAHFSSISGDSNKHCSTNFADSRRMIRSVRNLWGNLKFDHIALDYFYSPVQHFSYN